MDRAGTGRAKAIVLDALEHPPENWEAFVGYRCAGDSALAAEVRMLLGSEPPDGSPLALSFGGLLRAAHVGAGLDVGGVPNFTLMERIGEGGFGIVYRAEQFAPVRRGRVAVKVLKPGMDSRRVLERFERERQILARLGHPNIATLYDAGATERGLPYFAMEYIGGLPITAYCAERGLSRSQRLRLFLDVCTAVQFAHQQGVIHRDLKPSNVLVAEIDGRAVPKVIDFGVAKAVGAEEAHSRVTDAGHAIGTPAYMSPEARACADGIDTRADVYALGVILHELLTGGLPPTEGPESDDAATRRGERRPAPLRAPKGDLGTILRTALSVDRERRYQSVGELAADIGRFLRSEPITARPPSLLYLLRTFARRRRGLVASATVMGGALLASVAGLATLYAVARDERARVTVASNSACAALQQLAVALSEFEDPASQRLAAAAWRGAYDVIVATDGIAHPEAPKVAWNAAIVFERAGEFEHAARLYREAHDEYRRRQGPQGGEARATLWGLGRTNLALGRAEAARNHFAELLELLRERPATAEVMREAWTAGARAEESMGDLAAATALREELGRLP